MKSSIVAATVAASLLASIAHAQDYQAIAQELYDQGFENQATIRVRSDGLYVETSGSAGTTERVYSLDGTVLREEETLTSDGRKIEREYDEQGSLVEEEIEDAATAGQKRGAVIERAYTVDGTLAKEEITTPGGTRIERTYDAEGNVVSNEVMRDGWDEPRGRGAGQRDDKPEADSDSDSDSDDDRGSRSDNGRGNGKGNGKGRG